MSGPVLTDPIVIDPNKVEIDPNDPSTNSISGKLVTPTFRDTLGTVEPTIDPIEELPPGHQNAYLESTPLELVKLANTLSFESCELLLANLDQKKEVDKVTKIQEVEDLSDAIAALPKEVRKDVRNRIAEIAQRKTVVGLRNELAQEPDLLQEFDQYLKDNKISPNDLASEDKVTSSALRTIFDDKLKSLSERRRNREYIREQQEAIPADQKHECEGYLRSEKIDLSDFSKLSGKKEARAAELYRYFESSRDTEEKKTTDHSNERRQSIIHTHSNSYVGYKLNQEASQLASWISTFLDSATGLSTEGKIELTSPITDLSDIQKKLPTGNEKLTLEDQAKLANVVLDLREGATTLAHELDFERTRILTAFPELSAFERNPEACFRRYQNDLTLSGPLRELQQITGALYGLNEISPANPLTTSDFLTYTKNAAEVSGTPAAAQLRMMIATTLPPNDAPQWVWDDWQRHQVEALAIGASALTDPTNTERYIEGDAAKRKELRERESTSKSRAASWEITKHTMEIKTK